MLISISLSLYQKGISGQSSKMIKVYLRLKMLPCSFMHIVMVNRCVCPVISFPKFIFEYYSAHQQMLIRKVMFHLTLPLPTIIKRILSVCSERLRFI